MQPERMRVFVAAAELAGAVDLLLPLIPPGSANAADHLARSAESVLFNVGEGIEAWKPKVKLAIYELARREVNEIRAILRRLVRRGVLTREQVRHAYNLAGAVIAMLTNAARAIENGKGRVA